MRKVVREKSLADADRESGKAQSRHRGAWRAIDRGAVDCGPRTIALVAVTVILEAMRRHEHRVDDEALAAGSRQARDLPIVDDRSLPAANEKIEKGRRLALLLEKRAADQPIGVIDPARESEFARQHGAARDAARLA